MTMLRFPDLDTLRLALTSGSVPAAVANAPASAAFEGAGAGAGAVLVRPSGKLARGALGELKRLGVAPVEAGRDARLVDVRCWPELLPLSKDRSAGVPPEATPVYFELDEADFGGFLDEVLRLGNDRLSFRWLTDGDRPSALLRVVGPPYFALLRAVDRLDRDAGPVAYVEQAPGVLVESGFRHPLADRLAPPPGRLLLIREPRRWRAVEAGPFRDIYGLLAFTLPEAPADLREAEPPGRFPVRLRLARGPASESPTLWVLRDRAEEQVEALVRDSDDRLLARLAFAVAEPEGEGQGGPVVVIRARPSKEPPPALALEGVGYRPHLRLPNLFVPAGSRLHPPLRRDPVARLLAPDPDRITWLAPLGDGGGFVPESLPDSAFRPLDGWVDYVLDREHRPLRAWVESSRFDFEPFACVDEGPVEAAPKGRSRKGKGKAEAGDPVEVPAAAAPAPAKAPRARRAPAPMPPSPRAPDAAVARLRELESAYRDLPTPPEDEARRALLLEMAGLNARLDRPADASTCWAMASWERDAPTAEVASAWAEAVADRGPGRSLADPGELDRLLEADAPGGDPLRALAAGLIRAAFAGGEWPALAGRLGRVGLAFERHEARLPARVSWLAWRAIARLAGGDVLALARARDRLLERLHAGGLRPDLDLPGFLRAGAGPSGDRVRLVRDHLVAARDPALAWLGRGHMVAPHTGALADLIFAHGLARLGERDLAARLLAGARESARDRDAVMILLLGAFEHRIARALEGAPDAGPLPPDLMSRLDRMGKEGGEEDRKREKEQRYKIDRLREHSRILEPLERINPYRHWNGARAEDLIRELGAWPDVADRGELAARVARALAAGRDGPEAPAQRARVLREALEVAYRLGEATAEGLLGRVLPAVEEQAGDPVRQADLLEKGLRVAAHFDRPAHLRSLVDRFAGLLDSGGPKAAATLEPVLGQCFRGLRKLGMRDEVEGLLGRISRAILGARELAEPGPRSGPAALEWSRAIKPMLQVASAWFDLGQSDRPVPVLDEARALLLEGDLIPIEQTSLCCAYLRSMALAPADLALPRMAEVFERVERVHDSFTTNSHYSLTRLDVIEAAVTTLVSDDFTLDRTGRGRLEDEEYLVRRRVHRDVRAALGAGLP